MEPDISQKGHRARHSGPKAEKKKAKKDHKQTLNAKQRNPKAFAIQSVNKAQKKFQRTADIKTKKQHIPKVDRTPTEPPPIVVAIIGPPKVGKSTLLKCLIKNYTKQRLTNIQGPVTVIAGKNRRITFIECNNDINCMIDIGKIADLALLMVDAKQGFEMEVFELFNICQATGFPRCMGVLNHLDMYKDSKALRKRKKQLKNRFEVELYKGARLFYLSMLINEEYLQNEVHNLCRFISVMKMTPLVWRNTHPYVLADRMEDITNPEAIRQNPKCDRTVSLYGFVHGTHMKSKSLIHLAGCGDYYIRNMTYLPDPCPTPTMEKRRSLNVKERNIYAPMSGVGGIVYDKDAVYIDMQKNQMPDEEGPTGLVAALMTSAKPMDEKMQDSQISIFKGGPAISGTDASAGGGDDTESEEESGYAQDSGMEEDEEDSEDEMDDVSFENSNSTPTNQKKRKKKNQELNVDQEDSIDEANNEDEEIDNDEEESFMWKKSLYEKASAKQKKKNSTNYSKLIYGDEDTEKSEVSDNSDDEGDLGGLFKILKKQTQDADKEKRSVNRKDCNLPEPEDVNDLDFEELKEEIMDTFVTGKWDASEDAKSRLAEDDDIFGDFEDLESGEKFTGQTDDLNEDTNGESDDEMDGQGEKQLNSENEDSAEVDRKKTKAEMSAHERRMQKKKKMKETFDNEYDMKGDNEYYDSWREETQKQAEMNKSEFEDMPEELRVQYEGFRPGMYVRMEFEGMPCELVSHFDPTYPVVVGGMTSVEEKLGYVNVRIKKHRWYKKILKSRNPLIMSMGWRRFQTIPHFYKLEDNMRQRALKYTPEHIHCQACFWGPLTPQGTGFLAVESLSNSTADFRIAATGVVLQLDQTTEIEKKLKLVGHPTKVFKKSAFIKDMFSTGLEVAKFQGAKIQTVSGLRGQVKKALHSPPGAFRASFEDKIKMSDIVFLKAWVKLDIPRFIMPVTNLLLDAANKHGWQGMRSVGTLRHQRGLPVPSKNDSLYKPIIRGERVRKPLVIPASLKHRLPFKDLPKQLKGAPETQRVAVVLEPHEAKVAQFLKRVKAIHKDKSIRAHREMRKRAQTHERKKKAEDAIRQEKLKESKKRLHEILGRMKQKKDDARS